MYHGHQYFLFVSNVESNKNVDDKSLWMLGKYYCCWSIKNSLTSIMKHVTKIQYYSIIFLWKCQNWFYYGVKYWFNGDNLDLISYYWPEKRSLVIWMHICIWITFGSSYRQYDFIWCLWYPLIYIESRCILISSSM